MIVISFEDLQKISLFPKFEGCGLKIESATPILILNFPRAWQSYFLRYTLEISISYRFFIDKKMMFYSFFVSSTRQLKFEKSCFFFFRIAPKWYKKSWLWTIIYHWGLLQRRKCSFFSNYSSPVEDTEKWINKTENTFSL